MSTTRVGVSHSHRCQATVIGAHGEVPACEGTCESHIDIVVCVRIVHVSVGVPVHAYVSVCVFE